MKKILSAVFALFTGTVLFAQSAEYEDLLAKAQKYELEKKWVYALDAYYNALKSEQTELAIPAYTSFKNLLSVIESGEPGYGEFDAFTIYDGWIKLLQEFETYWTNSCPYTFSFEKIERISLDIKNQTADYKISCKKIELPKFTMIYNAVKKGAETKKDGGISQWPEKSIYAIQNGDSIKTNVLYNDAALYQNYMYVEGYNTVLGPCNWIETGKIQPAGSGKIYFQLIISDKKGNFLMKHDFSSKEIEWNDTLLLRGVPKNLVSIFDSGDIDIVLSKDAKLAYSIYKEDIEDIISHQKSYDYRKNLPEAELQKFLKLNLKELTLPIKVEFSSEILNPLSFFERKEEEKSIAEQEQQKIEQQNLKYSSICKNFVSNIGGKSSDIKSISLTLGKNNEHIFKVPISFLEENSINEEIIIRNYSRNDISVSLTARLNGKTHSWDKCKVGTRNYNSWSNQTNYYGEEHIKVSFSKNFYEKL